MAKRGLTIGGLLVALGAAANSYLQVAPLSDPHLNSVFGAVGAVLAAFGQSLLPQHE